MEQRRGSFRGYGRRFEKMLFPVIFFRMPRITPPEAFPSHHPRKRFGLSLGFGNSIRLHEIHCERERGIAIGMTACMTFVILKS